MDLENRYPDLYQFIGAWFPDVDFEELTDADIVARFAEVSDASRLRRVVTQAESLLSGDPDEALALGETGNLFFETVEEATTWLDNLLDLVRQRIPPA